MDLEGDSPWGDVPASRPTPAEDTPETESDPQATATPARLSAPSTGTANVKTPGGRGGRTPRRFVAQPTRVETLDDDLGPLGPLGAAPAPEVEQPPALPQKEDTLPRTSRPSTATSQASKAKGLGLDEGEDENGLPHRPRIPPPVQPQSQASAARQSHPSVSIEQAARPTFNISVGDAHKVGDLTSSHTVFQVRTKTTSKAYRQPEFEVSRRYRDFLWLYEQLHKNNPGIIVPPPPEKQSVGRFELDFVESRRSALERMLNKIAGHLILQHDGDLKIFLESEAFSVDVKARERKDPDMPQESKGMFSGLSLSVGSGTKYIEHDDWFLDRRVYLDTLEAQLRGLLRSTDAAVAQRKHLADACAELSISLNDLSQVELSPSLSGPLASLADVQLRIRDLYNRQAQQDVLTLGIVIDEYIRTTGSIKKAFEQRQRSWQNWHNAETDLQKRRAALDKLSRSGRTQQDRMSQLQADVGDAERRAHQMRLTFDDLGKGMRAELERFEREKVEDFRAGVETFLESSVEAQKELIELWETYLMFLDADEQEENDSAKGQLPTRQAGSEGGVKAGGAAAEEGTSSTDAETAASVAPPVEQEP